MSESVSSGRGDLGRFVEILGRRKWMLIGVALVITIVAVAYSFMQTPLYTASSKLLITNTDIPAAVAGVSDAEPAEDPLRVATTEVQIVQLRDVIERARVAAGADDRTVDELRNEISVSVGQDSNVITVEVTDPDRAQASRLADSIAAEYVAYRRELDTSKLQAARADLLAEIARLRANGTTSGAYYDDLLSASQQLATIATVGASNYNVVEEAGEAAQTSPSPVRDGVIAAIIGLIVGLATALVVDRLDRRVRSIGEIEQILGVSMLARVDDGSRDAPRGGDAVAALDDPQGDAAESFRILRANFDFTNAVAAARVVMVTGTGPGEAKSSVAANLAYTLAAAGRRVALVDLDIRRPSVHALFDVSQAPGATQVAAGTAELADVTTVVSVPAAAESLGGAGDDDTGIEGKLLVVPAGLQPPNPGQFIASRAIVHLIEQLRSVAEVVIVDVPPLLACGDAKSLAPTVDGVMLVLPRVGVTQPVLDEVRREIDVTACPILGFVVNESQGRPGYSSYSKRDRGGGGDPMSTRPSKRSLRVST